MELVIEGKTQGLKWSAAHVIPNHPKCGRLHGHDYTLDIKILMPESVQNMKTVKEKGYLLDYGDVKKAAKEIIEPLDHKFLVPNSASTKASTKVGGDRIEYQEITTPARMACFLPVEVVSSENLSLYFKNKMMEAFPDYVIICKVNEGEGQGVWI